ncbi:alpha/beta-hydrolase [Testicularia cyperi]|uniref:Alpha/beta-hydrolase n=1 Tax=Testicularia cyperi TaxID=1882483 RepID=A0A317XDZ3_9BASI|nr:alpha/beta-hydrolase [Testicularia cyperi]
MPNFWPFYRSPPAHPPIPTAPPPEEPGDTKSSRPPATPPLIICEGFLSAAQSVVWGNEFRTYLGVGHQQLIDQTAGHSALSSQSSQQRPKRRSGLGSDRPVIFAPIGPVSSLHDRACELFYALRGGTVDYGEKHARQHGHARYGRHYRQPLCPTWGPRLKHSPPPTQATSDMNKDTDFPAIEVDYGLPAHFIGHSLGGPTILKLQQLLRQGFFDEALGYDRASRRHVHACSGSASEWCPADLILSVTSVSSPFRGTPIVYSLGSEPLPYPKVRMFSFGDILSKFVHIAAFLDLPFFDPHADAWHFSAKKRREIQQASLSGGTATVEERQDADGGTERARDVEQGRTGLADTPDRSGLRDLLKQLWRSDWAGGRDCAPWDCTFAQREQDRSEEGWGLEMQCSDDVGPPRRGKTWYRSYAGGMTVSEPTRDESKESSKPWDTSRGCFHRPSSYWSLSPLTFTAHLIGHFDYARLDPKPSFLPETGTKDLSSAWWENDGVVPLASQFHPLECSPERCTHFSGMPASLPFGRRRKRPQSADLRRAGSSPLLENASLPVATQSEAEPFPTASGALSLDHGVDPTSSSSAVGSPEGPLTPISLEEHDANLHLWHAEQSRALRKAVEKEECRDQLLPLPATSRSADSIVGSARSAARVAYFTSLRALNFHDPPLLTPTEEELRSFLPYLATPQSEILPSLTGDTAVDGNTPKVSQNASSAMERTPSSQSQIQDLTDPEPNKWYTFQLENLDHTSLCPFWTGSELQKQFWTGMGFFLASVDRKAEYRVV